MEMESHAEILTADEVARLIPGSMVLATVRGRCPDGMPLGPEAIKDRSKRVLS